MNTTDTDAGLDITRAEFERACSLLPPEFVWGLPVTPRLVLDVAEATLLSASKPARAQPPVADGQTDGATVALSGNPGTELLPLIASYGAAERSAGYCEGSDDLFNAAAERAEASLDGICSLLAATHAPAMAETQFDMLAHLQRQRDFSERTFGPGARTKGVVDHIRKELIEVEHNPGDFSEWADVVILALDGFWRAGATPQQIIDTIVAKQAKNEGRTWPDWRTADPNKAIEHDRTGEACPQCHGKGTMMFHDPEEAWEVPCGICNIDRAAASGGEQG